MLSSDHQLLKQHLRHPSGGALTTLIERFLPLVLSVARRITANDEAARDISQTVFLRLLKKAPNIPSTLPLTAWFHRETHSASVDHVRSEVRRQQREQTAASLNTMKSTPDPWPQLPAPRSNGLKKSQHPSYATRSPAAPLPPGRIKIRKPLINGPVKTTFNPTSNPNSLS